MRPSPPARGSNPWLPKKRSSPRGRHPLHAPFRGRSSRGSQGFEPLAGFSLIEVLIALAIFLVGAAFAAQLLQETSQQLADIAAEQIEAPMPLVRARVRGDIQASHAARCVLRPDGTPEEIRLFRHPMGTVIYHVDEGVLSRRVEDHRGQTLEEGPVLHGIESWSCADDGGGLLLLEIVRRVRVVRRTPLAVEPGARGPLTDSQAESLLAAPRGGGLGAGW